MNLATFSPALVVLFVCALLFILMDVQFADFNSKQRTIIPIFILSLAIAHHFLRVALGSTIYSYFMMLTLHLPVFLLFLYITRCGVIKMIFMILTAVVFTSPTVIIGNILKQSLVEHVTIALLLSNLLVYGIMLLLAYFVFKDGFTYLLKHGTNRSFLYLSLIPLMFYVYVFAIANLDMSSINSFAGYTIRFLPFIEVFVFYFLLLANYRELSVKNELEVLQATLARELTAAEEQIQLLNEAQKLTAIYQHDMRHHLNIINAFLTSNKSSKAIEYIKKVQIDVDNITPKRFCEHELINQLCSLYSNKAEQLDISISYEIKVPRNTSVSDTDLCSLLSNGLENALHAVSHLEDSKRYISFYCCVKHNKILIEIKNPYEGTITIKNGLPISSIQGHGYGCKSIRTIIEHNRGLCTFETENNTFTLRAVLPF